MTSDIKEVIARVKADNERATRLNWGYTFLRPDDAVALLSAADAGIAARDAATGNDCLQVQTKARDAALEEAAAIADRWAKGARYDDMQDRRDLGDDYDPNCWGSGYNCGVCESGVQIAEEIRALRSKP